MELAKTLTDQVRGQVLDPASEGYEQARSVWNGTVERRPAAIVKATEVGDVIAAVRAARRTGLDLAIRCGGHSIQGLSTCDDGILLDLSGMREVRVDPEARIAEVGGGALLADLDRASMAHGLVTPTGTVSHTGVAGLALGGGLGRLMRKHGATCDNIAWVDLVTADGELIRVSEDEEPELFWGIRGAGSNFGVVTRFGFALHPQNETCWGAIAIHAPEDAREVLAFYADYAPAVPDAMICIASLGTLDAGGPFPPELIGRKAIVLSASHCGDTEEEAAAATEPMRSFGSPLHTMFVGLPYLFFQGMMDAAYPWGGRFYDKGGYLDALTGDVIDTMLEQHAAAAPGNSLALFGLGGAFGRVPEDAMAFSGRNAPFFMNLETRWDDPADDEQRVGWGRTVGRAMTPHFSNANYINAVEAGEADSIRRAYGDEKYKRLIELKRRWDPDNVFRLNHNIDPRG